ncbi:dTDP-4-amino-4,6-dideoxygalactose transaminase [Dokdonia sp. Hel_I_63]|uniref:DegT/DnrJ/EryC1/StrS family aminotransferase n=1 Tax=unclassified Dokdonia TaxID=2615033 RepID=UPI00020A669C|nr:MULTISPECIES: DegT/DnrJ/EryC1/StrS family aminotransferase [unclassified Dokdonia]AEE20081.1 DegT/DnrJ/EryC1/StrS aminotransferase [Dokdonia sp. 4H-3-7-5]TVZ23664.1 dTDP-4-amino-4,6-dideoxygalactose transaminase [Dokdonia sp. Hel_I_63]
MIPFLDLKKINAPFEQEFKNKFDSFLAEGWFVLGEEVQLFEAEYAQYCGTTHCVGTANGLDALRLIFEGYKILEQLQEGDEVLVASNTYIATIIAIKQAGLIPVLVEASLLTYNFDFEDLEHKITLKTKVVLPTHLYGKLTDMERINAFAKAYNLFVITDCAQSHGAKDVKGNRSGSLADASAHSFYPTKNLGALGDAGAITTDNESLAQVVKKYRNYGFKERYVAEYAGVNSRLDELQAAFLRIKLRELDIQNQKRREIAIQYLSKIDNKHILLPQLDKEENHVWHLFVIRSVYRDQLQTHLQNQGIGTNIHYPVPPHKQEALSEYNMQSFPVCQQLHNEVLSIPLSPALSEENVEEIITALNNFRC